VERGDFGARPAQHRRRLDRTAEFQRLEGVFATG
jgi:hypothetical protein